MTPRVYLFPDTNVFLQCKALQEIDWHSCGALAEFDDIYLLICNPVLQEIDDLKYRNDRVGRRANKTYTIARRLITGKVAQEAISNEGPAVKLQEETGVRPSPDLLDYATCDERIVGCAHAYQIAHPDREVRFLTHDAGAMATARNLDVPFVIVPDDWRLAPPPSATERKVVELEAEIRRLQQTQPQFDIQFRSSAEGSINEIEGQCLAARSLTDNEVSQFISRLRSSVPHSRTQDWLERCEQALRNLHTSIQHQSDRPCVEVAVTNQGTRPAKDALIEIIGHGPVLLAVPLDHDDNLSRKYRHEPIRLPSPPRIVDASQFRPNIDLLGPRDRGSDNPNAFYYKPQRPWRPVPTIALECQQWRHESGEEHFEFEIYVDSELPNIEGRVECRIHAANLPNPARAFVRVALAGQVVDITERAARLVEKTAQQARADAALLGLDPTFGRRAPR